jgi:hypothetical protein
MPGMIQDVGAIVAGVGGKAQRAMIPGRVSALGNL